jgi:hypothetical protein
MVDRLDYADGNPISDRKYKTIIISPRESASVFAANVTDELPTALEGLVLDDLDPNAHILVVSRLTETQVMSIKNVLETARGGNPQTCITNARRAICTKLQEMLTH